MIQRFEIHFTYSAVSLHSMVQYITTQYNLHNDKQIRSRQVTKLVRRDIIKSRIKRL